MKNELIPVAGDSESANIEQIERFQSLEPGSYWRNAEDVTVDDPNWRGHKTTIEGGLVRLLLDVECYDGIPHTVVLSYHPLEGNGTFKLIVADFLASFEVALDAEEVRQREMLALQKEIADVQQELVDGQTNPTLIAPVIEQELAEWEKEKQGEDAKEGIESTPSNLPVLAGGRLRTDVGFAIGQKLSDSDVRGMRRYAEREAKIAEVKTKWITERTDEIARKLSALTPFFKEKSAVALARTQGVRRYAEEIMKGIESLDLYTGKGVEVETIATGESAPENEPLTLMQSKVYMDEEFAAWADVGEHFDFANIPEFDKQLAANPSLRDQVLPYPRCVASMAIRRTDIDYGDVWANVTRNQRNKLVFLLVRDGDNLYRVYSEQPSHEVARRLFPTKNELDYEFRGIDGTKINFRDVQFTKAAASADRIALHYKRFLILLCGLDHRLSLFGNFYGEQQSLAFISMGFQERYMRFIADDEPPLMIGKTRPHVFDYIKQKNAFLQSGSRVLCVWNSIISPDSAPSCERRNGKYVDTLAKPTVESSIAIAYRDGGEICVDVEVKRDTWRELIQTHFKARVSLTKVITESYRELSGFICLDSVKADDLEWYVFNRQSRISHTHYIRLFKETAKALRAEEVTEAPAREYIKQAIVNANICSADAADEFVDESVAAWRCANRGKALPSLAEKSQLDTILNLLYTKHKNSDTVESHADKFIAEHKLVPIKLTLTGKNKVVLYVEVGEENRDNSLMEWRWVRRISCNVLKSKLSVTSERLYWLTNKPDAKETELKSWPALANWVNEDAEPINPKTLQAVRDAQSEGFKTATIAFIGKDAGIEPAIFNRLLNAMREIHYESKKQVRNVVLSVPLAVYVLTGREKPFPVHICVSEEMQCWLYHFGNAEQKQIVEKAFCRTFANKKAAYGRLTSAFKPRLVAIKDDCEQIDGMFVSEYTSSAEHLTEANTIRIKSKEKGFFAYESTKHRSMNHTFERWVKILNGEIKLNRTSVPKKVIIHPETIRGSKAMLEKFFSGKAQKPQTDATGEE